LRSETELDGFLGNQRSCKNNAKGNLIKMSKKPKWLFASFISNFIDQQRKGVEILSLFRDVFEASLTHF